MSAAAEAVRFITSVVSRTILFPASNSRELLAGMVVEVKSSTGWLSSLFAPLRLPVSVLRVKVTVMSELCVFPIIRPMTTVVVEPATVYMTSLEVTPAFDICLKVLAILDFSYYPKAIIRPIALASEIPPDAAAHDISVPSEVNTSLAEPTASAAGSPLVSP